MLKTYQILICEDEKLNFVLLKKLIEKSYEKNIVIYHATDGKQAVDICDSSIDLILMDVEMPVMNGFEASRIIRSKFPDIPIVMQTAHCSQFHKEKAETIGCKAFLSKPIIRKDFDEVLNLYAPKH